MQKIAEHKILLKAISYQQSREKVSSFFEKTSLVLYESIDIVEGKSFCGSAPEFSDTLSVAQNINHQFMNDLIETLDSEGNHTIKDFKSLKQGYLSKTLHLLAHFLDGFIGIDSAFYNLIDDSHEILENTKSEMEKAPNLYWLIHVDAFSVGS